MSDDFTRGYLLAVSNMMHLHDCEVIAEDTLSQLGVTEGVIAKLDLEPFDAKPLRRLFREISRKRQLTKASSALASADAVMGEGE